MSSKNTKTDAKTVEAKLEPNLIFTGKRTRLDKETGKAETVARDSPAFIINGRDKITLPDDLSKGAFVEPVHAETAKKLFPNEMKHPVKKPATE